MWDRSHEVPLRRYTLIRMRGFSARTGSSRWPFPQTALPDGSMNSMTLAQHLQEVIHEVDEPLCTF